MANGGTSKGRPIGRPSNISRRGSAGETAAPRLPPSPLFVALLVRPGKIPVVRRTVIEAATVRYAVPRLGRWARTRRGGCGSFIRRPGKRTGGSHQQDGKHQDNCEFLHHPILRGILPWRRPSPTPRDLASIHTQRPCQALVASGWVTYIVSAEGIAGLLLDSQYRWQGTAGRPFCRLLRPFGRLPHPFW